MLALTSDPYPAAPTPSDDVEAPETDQVRADRAQVKLKLARIKESKRKFDPDYKRMRANMEFESGLQWPNQVDLQDDRYSCNLIKRLVAQKVAQLYAKNPTVEVTRRPLLDFQVWSEDPLELEQALMAAHTITATGGILPPQLEMLLSDVQAGKQRQMVIDKVCSTLNKTYTYFQDCAKPDYKEQCKTMVRYAVVCGVGYIRTTYCSNSNEQYKQVNSTDTGSTQQDRINRARTILEKRQENEIDDSDAQMGALKSLIMSIGASQALDDEDKLPERLEFDFPLPTAVIPDTRCRNLKEFVAARWVAIEYILPVDEVNALFGTDIDVGSAEGQATDYQISNDTLLVQPNKDQVGPDDPYQRHLVSLYEVFDYNDKTRCFVVQGWKDYVLPPEPCSPSVSGFWPIQALTFNDNVVDPDTRTSIFPPSDVDLCRSAQREWNRTRNALRDQRNANAPKYIVRKGALTDEDIIKLKNAEPNSVLQLEGIPPEVDPRTFIGVMQVAAIDEKVYNTDPLEQDIMLAAGAQQANIGPAQPNVTATVGTIAEQSRMTVSASNIDDLDGVLSRSAQSGVEMLARAFPTQMFQITAGVGATMPDLLREEVIREINIKVKAASSGRPNKAVEIQNFQQIAPILLQSGANPIGVIAEGVRRLDDMLDVTKFLPQPIPISPDEQPAPNAGGPSSGPSTPPPSSQPPKPMGPSPVGPPTNQTGAPIMANGHHVVSAQPPTPA